MFPGIITYSLEPKRPFYVSLKEWTSKTSCHDRLMSWLGRPVPGQKTRRASVSVDFFRCLFDQKPGYLLYIGDYTTKLGISLSQCKDPYEGIIRVLNIAHMKVRDALQTWRGIGMPSPKQLGCWWAFEKKANFNCGLCGISFGRNDLIGKYHTV